MGSLSLSCSTQPYIFSLRSSGPARMGGCSSECMLERTAGEVHATACWQHLRGYDLLMS